jgi:anti-sigma factor ChrR (cupin superfamily)
LEQIAYRVVESQWRWEISGRRRKALEAQRERLCWMRAASQTSGSSGARYFDGL